MSYFALLGHRDAPKHKPIIDEWNEPSQCWVVEIDSDPPDMIHRRLKSGVIQVFKRDKTEHGPYYDSHDYILDMDTMDYYYRYDLKREILEIEE